MTEQQAKFVALGIRAEYVGESQTDATVWRWVNNGDVQLLYISPENIICNPRYRHMLSASKYMEHLVGVVVDEAHCIKTW